MLRALDGRRCVVAPAPSHPHRGEPAGRSKGHSTILLEVDGHRFLTDPVWSERVGPVDFAGPKRFFPPLLAIHDLPPLDAVLISHDHYDHLDYATIVTLKDRAPMFVCPLGVGAHLERWGVAAAKIIEVDWWDSRSFGDLTLWAVPARHASGQSVEPTLERPQEHWWPSLPWRTAAEYPIVADHAD